MRRRARSSKRASFSSFPKAEAQWDYKAGASDELSFKAGAKLHIIEMSGDWWTASDMNGKTGQVPSNFLQLLDQPNVAHAANYLSGRI